MQIAYTPNTLTSDYISVKNELDAVKKDRDDTKNELKSLRSTCNTQAIQIETLQNVNRVCTDMLNSVGDSRVSPSRAAWLRRNILTLTQKIKDLVVDLPFRTGRQLASVFKNLYDIAVAVCNFIHDHFDSIIIGAALALAGTAILFNVVLLGACVAGAVSGSTALATGSTAVFIDYALINSFV